MYSIAELEKINKTIHGIYKRQYANEQIGKKLTKQHIDYIKTKV